MEYRQLGNSGLDISVLSLGTMTFGEQNSEAEAHTQLDLAISRGVNFIDTAEMYPIPPRSETVHRTESYIGSWLKGRQRDQLIIASKIAGPSRGFQWIRQVPMFGASSYGASNEYEAIPIEEQLQALAELVQAGKVRYIGLSNETPWGVSEFIRCAEALVLPRVVSTRMPTT